MKYMQNKVCVSLGYVALLVTSLLFIPVPWVFAWLVASSIHEAGHLFALFLSDNMDCRMYLSAMGPRIQYIPKSNIQHVVCALAGPCVGVLPVLFVHTFPRIGICALVQTLCNFLPIYPLDGGQILFAALKCILSVEHARRMLVVIEWITILTLLTIMICTAIRYCSTLLPLLSVSILAIRAYRIKSSCKQGRERVQ